jgi:hypothetical protein
MQRRPHGFYLAVERNQQSPSPRMDLSSVAPKDTKVTLLIDAAENATACKPKQRLRALHLGYVDTNFMSIKSLPPAERWNGEAILVISDQHTWAFASFNRSLDANLKSK